MAAAWKRRATQDGRPKVMQRIRREADEAMAAGRLLQQLHAQAVEIIVAGQRL